MGIIAEQSRTNFHRDYPKSFRIEGCGNEVQRLGIPEYDPVIVVVGHESGGSFHYVDGSEEGKSVLVESETAHSMFVDGVPYFVWGT